MRITSVIIIILLRSFYGFSQSDEYIPNIKPLEFKKYFGVGYSIGTPVSEMSENFSPWSYSGAFGEYKSYIKDNLTVGVEMAWISFYGESERETYQIENGAITGQLLRFYNNLSSAITCTYNVLYDTKYQIFIGCGAGLFYNNEELRIGNLTQRDTKWTIGVMPECGFYRSLTPSGQLGISFTTRYNYVPYRSVYFDSAQYINFKIGSALRL